jgi:diadenosine tetraphosphatase ApaH/serine/threonine PP2A family protein phosphatase
MGWGVGMRQAIVSDIHSNMEALQTCLAHARLQGATHFACLGDCVGYGADPGPTLALLMSLPDLLLVRGNHDEALFNAKVIDVPGIRESIDWARDHLSPAQLDLLQQAPYVRQVGTVTYAHASAYAPEQWEYLRHFEQIHDCLAATDAHVTFIGHVHVPMVFYRAADGSLHEFDPQPDAPIPLSSGCRYVVNVGSVGQPRDGKNTASYAIYDDAAAEVTFFRLPYNYLAAGNKILAAGLTPRFAERLADGS